MTTVIWILVLVLVVQFIVMVFALVWCLKGQRELEKHIQTLKELRKDLPSMKNPI